MGEDNAGEPTKFNMAIATLQRMDELLRASSEYALRYDLRMWYNCLFELRRNICAFIKEEEFEELEALFKEINSNHWISSRDGKIIPGEQNRVYNLLDKVIIKTQKAMASAGLLMPKSDDPRLAIQG